MKEGLIPDKSRFPSSRDWEEIHCSARACVYHDKIANCTVPSLAVIGEEGRCMNFKTVYDKPKEEPVVVDWAHGDGDNCPECGEAYTISCRCMISDRSCKNGHSWHRCLVHKIWVKGDGNHSIDYRFCQGKTKACHC